jgi:hypothetical protein
MHAARLVNENKKDLKDTNGNTFQAIGNKQKHLLDAELFQVLEDFFLNECQFGRDNRISKDFFRPVLPDADRNIEGIFGHGVMLEENVGRI